MTHSCVWPSDLMPTMSADSLQHSSETSLKQAAFSSEAARSSARNSARLVAVSAASAQRLRADSSATWPSSSRKRSPSRASTFSMELSDAAAAQALCCSLISMATADRALIAAEASSATSRLRSAALASATAIARLSAFAATSPETLRTSCPKRSDICVETCSCISSFSASSRRNAPSSSVTALVHSALRSSTPLMASLTASLVPATRDLKSSTSASLAVTEESIFSCCSCIAPSSAPSLTPMRSTNDSKPSRRPAVASRSAA
mmetsp:Transcript_74152/g.206117  ORF Transcript_74152/g.206117 Transcript_74152/m.206117 type:complete len:263 (-) Transcript_74152:873-1661(-)